MAMDIVTTFNNTNVYLLLFIMLISSNSLFKGIINITQLQLFVLLLLLF